MTATVVVFGGSGFVGSAVLEALERHQASVRSAAAPRLSTSARTPEALMLEAGAHGDALAEAIEGADVVINAAGVSDAVSGGGDALFGANALLPAAISRALESLNSSARFIHVSSAAVQGRRTRLDESDRVRPFSPYSESKALGEVAIAGRSGSVTFRPTSVHGPGRDVTAQLSRFLSSSAGSVAGPGDRPTPQVLVHNVAEAIAYVALTPTEPPSIVLQPSEGMTTGELVRLLGNREPRHVPTLLARVIVLLTGFLGRASGRVAGGVRRLDMLWFGQAQEEGWLTKEGWQPDTNRGRWRSLA
jgi:UDP-glucose 4-epimerase